MITHLYSEGFKGLHERAFRFKPLTVLTGTNCSGKSSIIQTLLLARQASRSFVEGREPVYIPLNGPFDLKLGTIFDVLAFNAREGRSIVIDLEEEQKKSHWEFSVESDTDRYLACKSVPDQPFPGLVATRPGGFIYLSAMRAGQADLLSVQSLPHSELTIGCRGEHTADILNIFSQRSVDPALHHPNAGRLPLLKQVEHWLSEFVANVALKVETSPTLDAVGLRYLQGGHHAEWIRPSNTGFGLSYCLPIVVAGLLGGPGSLLIVDSPEAHLHPAAQSAMGRFLARLAAHGIQTIIETHSDHIIHGIRLAALQDEHPFSPEDAIFHFLTHGPDGLQHTPIEITRSGGLSDYPDHFFDQGERDLCNIVKAQRKAQ